jgi:hypothetical protein
MSFNKRFLPEIDVLKKRRENYDNDRDFFNAIVGKADCFIGSEESLNYLDEIEESLRKNEKEE